MAVTVARVARVARGVAHRTCASFSTTAAAAASGGGKSNAFGSSLPAVVAAAGWDGAWAAGVTPWDAGVHAPVIDHLLASGSLPAGDVLVPGCGAGYDAQAFARAGRTVVGLDLSPLALRRATDLAAADPALAVLPKGRLTFRDADFFTYTHAPFGVIFDYTFMSALPPELWDAWADTTKRLLSPDGCVGVCWGGVGQLRSYDHTHDTRCCAMQATGDAHLPYRRLQGRTAVCGAAGAVRVLTAFQQRPQLTVPRSPTPTPYPLRCRVRALLEAHDFECVEMRPLPATLSHAARGGREALGRWRLSTARFPAIRARS